MRLSLQYRMVALFGGLTAVSLGSVLLLTLRWSSEQMRREISSQLLQRRDTLKHIHLAASAERARRVESLGVEPRIRALVEEADRKTLEFAAAELRKDLGYEAVSFLSTAGEVLAWDGAGEDALAGNLSSLLSEKLGEPVLRTALVGDKAVELIVTPLHLGDSVKGYLLAAGALDPKILGDYARTLGSRVQLRAKDRVLAEGSDNPTIGEDIRSIELPLGASVNFLIQMDIDEISKPWRDTFGVLWLICLGSFVLATSASLLLSYWLTRPIGELSRIAQRITAGDLSVRAEEKAAPELRGLARSFNEMVDAIEAARKELETYAEELEERVKQRTSKLEEEVRERREAERAVRESEKKTRMIVESAYDAFVSMNSEGLVTEWNPRAEALFGHSRAQALGEPFFEMILPPGSREEFTSGLKGFLATGKWSILNHRIEIAGRHRDGTELCIEMVIWSARLDGTYSFHAFLHDVSERKRLEIELRQAQKLESVGQLAAGIAHEINTPIQFVGDNTRFLQSAFDDLRALLEEYRKLVKKAPGLADDGAILGEVAKAEEKADMVFVEQEVPKAISQTLEGVQRVSAIVRAMKDFSHPDSKEKALADINQALQSTLTVARNELKYVADVETDFGELPMVSCHVGDLNQVFLNILVNGAHAITDVVKGTGQRGKIRVRTVCEGDTVLIAISDTGCGIPEGIRKKVFDPFFTTKGVGRGTGQGLSIARSTVVEKHGGTIHFESEVGRGTTFFIRIPVREPSKVASESK